MELRLLLTITRRWLWLIILSTVVAGTSSYFASQSSPRLYSTTTTLMVGRSIQSPDPNAYDIFLASQLALTYSKLVRYESVLNGAIEALNLRMSVDSLRSRVSSNILENTQLLEVHVVDSDPERAKALADEIANQLILQTPGATQNNQDSNFIKQQVDDLKLKIQDAQDEIARLQRERDASTSARQIAELNNQIVVLDNKVSAWQDTYSQLLLNLKGGDINTLSIIEPARKPNPDYPISPNIPMNVLLASAIGFGLAAVAAFLLEYLDDTIKSSEDAGQATNLTVIGSIARIEGADIREKLIAATQPRSPIVEGYRSLRLNLQYSAIDKPLNTLVLTSANPSEGKSVSASNLAVVLAQTGLKVLIVDADLRRPVQHQAFGVDNRFGLSDLIIHPEMRPEDFIQETGIANLSVLTCGPLPPNPVELLGSERMKAVMMQLKTIADIVVFDTPPILLVADSAVLGATVDGVLLVTDVNNTKKADARRAVEELRRVRANLLGVVANRAVGTRRGTYYYSYSYKPERAKKVSRNGHTSREAQQQASLQISNNEE